MIIRLGHLTRSQYVLRQHVPSLALADGLTLEECDALADWRVTPLFGARERAALAYADTMTRDIEVPDAVFAEVKRAFRPAPDRRIDRPDRHLQYERAGAAGARARFEPPPTRFRSFTSRQTDFRLKPAPSLRFLSLAGDLDGSCRRGRPFPAHGRRRARSEHRRRASCRLCGFLRPRRARLRRLLPGVRTRVGGLFPAQVRLVETEQAMRAALSGSAALIVELLNVDRQALAAATGLRIVQKYGLATRNIDTEACAAQDIKVLTIRRRANIACAEVALALMLTLAKKLHRLAGRISVEQLAELGYAYKPFDLRHTPNSNWARISGMRTLNGSTIGIIGLGEIGREIAIRAAAFGMRILYHQRSRLPPAQERELNASYSPLGTLLAESDWLVPQLPGGAATRGFIDRGASPRSSRAPAWSTSRAPTSWIAPR